MGEASDGIGELQKNVRKVIRSREEETSRIREALHDARSEWDGVLENAMGRVFRALDLPRRKDIEALSENLDRVAQALERLELRDGASASEGSESPSVTKADA